jgi:hypothetical protein
VENETQQKYLRLARAGYAEKVCSAVLVDQQLCGMIDPWKPIYSQCMNCERLKVICKKRPG